MFTFVIYVYCCLNDKNVYLFALRSDVQQFEQLFCTVPPYLTRMFWPPTRREYNFFVLCIICKNISLNKKNVYYNLTYLLSSFPHPLSNGLINFSDLSFLFQRSSKYTTSKKIRWKRTLLLFSRILFFSVSQLHF